MPAFDIVVVDTTGRGDAFDAGFIGALHRDMNPVDGIRLAEASGAPVATGLGSDAGIVSFEDTLEKSRNGKQLAREVADLRGR